MTYNSLNGLLQISNVTFTDFGASCSGQDYAISTNYKNDDGQHPVTITNTVFSNVDNSSKLWIHRPNLKKINPSDCVDMDCDGIFYIKLPKRPHFNFLNTVFNKN
jgi:hypothetical protein